MTLNLDYSATPFGLMSIGVWLYNPKWIHARRLFTGLNRNLKRLPTAFEKKAFAIRLHKENCDEINRDKVISDAGLNHNVPELCVCVLLGDQIL